MKHRKEGESIPNGFSVTVTERDEPRVYMWRWGNIVKVRLSFPKGPNRVGRLVFGIHTPSFDILELVIP